MEPQAIGNLLLGLLLAAGSVGTWLSTQQRKARTRNKQFVKDFLAFEAWVMASIKDRTLHNIQHHPDGQGAIEIPPLPEPMSRQEADE